VIRQEKMPISEKIAQLVTRIDDLSREGKIRWEETADENTFQAVVSAYTVQIKAEVDEYSAGTNYDLKILNSNNVVIEDVNSSDLNKFIPPSSTPILL
jgi:hypothetical protein